MKKSSLIITNFKIISLTIIKCLFSYHLVQQYLELQILIQQLINTINTSNLTNQGDINITTTNGTVKLTIGTNVYVWPTSPPPGYNYVLGIDNIKQ